MICGAQSLYIQPSARSAGMGDCTTAVTDDASASSWNPGGMAFMQGDISIAGVYSQLIPDWDDVYYKYGAAAVRVGDVAVVAASVTHLSYGEQMMTTPDDPEPFATFEPYEIIPSVALAVAVGENVGVGVNLKHAKVHMFPGSATVDGEDVEGTALAADVGVEWRADYGLGGGDLLLRAAGAIQHLGPDLEYLDEEQRSRLPNNGKLGASGQLSYGKAAHVLLCGQYEKSLVGGLDNGRSGIIAFGGELQLSVLGLTSQMEGGGSSATRDILTGRIGYMDDEDGQIEGMSYGFGVGVEIKNKVFLSLDFAKIPQAEGLTEPWRIGGSGWFAF